MYRVIFFLLFAIVLQPAFANASSCTSARLKSYSGRGKKFVKNSSASYSLRNAAQPQVLIGAKKIFTQAEKMIPLARRQILFQTWSFHAQSDPAKALFRGLARLQRKLWKSGRKGRPVHVWLLINVLPWENKDQKVQDLFKLKRKYKLANAYIKFHIGIWDTQLFAASHAKSLSIDNRFVLLTGANSSVKNNFKSSYFDLGFTFKGSVVSQINRNFRKAWKQAMEKDEDCSDNYANGYNSAVNCWERVKTSPKIQKSRPVRNSSCVPTLLVQNAARSNPFRSIQRSSQNYALLRAIRGARKSINILTPNLNVPEVVQALIKAAQKGVRVRVVLSKGHEAKNENLPTRGGSNRVTLNKMAAMVNKRVCSSLSVRWYSKNGRKAVYGSLPPNSHAKYILIDNRITYIGSMNMDMQSWVNSRELGLLIDDSTLSKKWKKQAFLPVYKRSVPTGLCR